MVILELVLEIRFALGYLDHEWLLGELSVELDEYSTTDSDRHNE